MNKKILISVSLILIVLIIFGILWITNFKDLKSEVSSTNTNKALEENNSFFGKVVESDTSYIIVEPDENEEERKASDKISIGLGEYSDVLYAVGTRVKITYTGGIMESYPAQVNAIKIEVKSADELELKILKNIDNNKMKKIINKDETDLYNYDIYEYNSDISIIVDRKEMQLKDALLKYPNLANEIVAKANNDLSNNKIKGDMYKDGGTMIYFYDEYTIIKMHTLDGNRDIYIGTPDMNLENIN